MIDVVYILGTVAFFALSINTFAGIEPPGAWRLFADLCAQLKVTAAFSLGATADLGHQRAALWRAAGLYARYAFTGQVALAVRAESYDDRDGFMTGAPRTLDSETATLEVRPVEHLILRLETRRDVPAIASAVAAF